MASFGNEVFSFLKVILSSYTIGFSNFYFYNAIVVCNVENYIADFVTSILWLEKVFTSVLLIVAGNTPLLKLCKQLINKQVLRYEFFPWYCKNYYYLYLYQHWLSVTFISYFIFCKFVYFIHFFVSIYRNISNVLIMVTNSSLSSIYVSLEIFYKLAWNYCLQKFLNTKGMKIKKICL